MTPTDIFYILKKHKARTIFWVAMSLLVLIVINRAGTVPDLRTEQSGVVESGLSQNSEVTVPIFSLSAKKSSDQGGRDIFILEQKEAAITETPASQDITQPKEETFPYIFTGVIEMKGEQIAVLESTGNYKVHFKRKGEEISEMKVIEIDKSRLVLKSGEGKEITLDRKTK